MVTGTCRSLVMVSFSVSRSQKNPLRQKQNRNVRYFLLMNLNKKYLTLSVLGLMLSYFTAGLAALASAKT